MTDEELRVLVNDTAVWARGIRDALNKKQEQIKDIEGSPFHDETDVAKATQAHDAIISERVDAKPTEQQAIDSLKPVVEPT